METGLNNLIQKIREDGVEEARKESQVIIDQANSRAEQIVKEAGDRKEAIIKEGKDAADKFRENAESSLKQAGRDALIALKRDITSLLDTVLKEKIDKSLSGDPLKEIIVKVVEGFRRDQDMDLEVVLSKKDKDQLEKAVLAELSSKAKDGVAFKVSKNMERGFRVGEKDGNFYYDFSDDAVAEALKKFLHPRLAEIMNIK